MSTAHDYSYLSTELWQKKFRDGDKTRERKERKHLIGFSIVFGMTVVALLIAVYVLA